MSCFVLSDNHIYNIAKFFIEINDTLPDNLKFSDSIIGFDDMSIDKEQRIRYLSYFLKHLNMLAYGARYNENVQESDVHLFVTDKTEMSLPRVLKLLGCYIYNCTEGSLVPMIIGMMHLDEILNFYKGKLTSEEMKEYEKPGWSF